MIGQLHYRCIKGNNYTKATAAHKKMSVMCQIPKVPRQLLPGAQLDFAVAAVKPYTWTIEETENNLYL